MSYFEEVYLKRVNKYGENPQERIQKEKIHRFKQTLVRSRNKVIVTKDDEVLEGLLENKTNSEKEVIDYLLTEKREAWPDGTILKTKSLVDCSEKNWLVFHVDEFASIGYNRYQIIELDRKIEWINDGIIYSQFVHFTGSGANLRDKSITSKFSVQFNIAAFYQPNKILNLIMQTNSYIKKGVRILIGDEVWKVSGIDKISVPGVSYITLEEDYIDKIDDNSIANSNKLENWSIQSSAGDSIFLTKDKSIEVKFFAYYNGILREEPYQVGIADTKLVSYYDNSFIAIEDGETYCDVFLTNTPAIRQRFKIIISEVPEEQLSLIGPTSMRVEGMGEYTFLGDYSEIAIASKNNNFEIVLWENGILKIKGARIGQDTIVVKRDNDILYEKEIDIESIWMEG